MSCQFLLTFLTEIYDKMYSYEKNTRAVKSIRNYHEKFTLFLVKYFEFSPPPHRDPWINNVCKIVTNRFTCVISSHKSKETNDNDNMTEVSNIAAVVRLRCTWVLYKLLRSSHQKCSHYLKRRNVTYGDVTKVTWR